MQGTALALGLSSLTLAAFPLIRPFFPFDPRTPVETLAGASPAVTSGRWLIAHYLALIGFVLLLCVLPALRARLAAAGVEGQARWAVLLSGVGVALILPTLGVELYALPAIGRLYLDGHHAVAALVGLIYRGAAVLVMLLGLLLLAIGAVLFARAVGGSGALPRWAATTYAAARPHRGRPADRRGRDRTRLGASARARPTTLSPSPLSPSPLSPSPCPLP
jgi:hypothetical protein